METFEFVNGISRSVHDRSVCEAEGFPCCIHNPSLHAMVEEPMLLRETSLVERLCRHGIGHPDPDSAGYFARRGHNMGVHGCDGCCVKLQESA